MGCSEHRGPVFGEHVEHTGEMTMMNEHGDFQESESSALWEGEADPCGAAKESRLASAIDEKAEKDSFFAVFESPLARCLWSFASFASEHPVLLFGASLGLQILTLSAAFGLAGWVLGW